MGKAETLRVALTIAGAAKAAAIAGADALVAAALAPRCAACGRALDAPLDGPVCGWCWEEAAGASGRYDGALRQIIHAFKYEGRRSLARPLGRLLRELGAGVLDEAAAVVPVPLYPWRRLQRGFNQAAELARHLDRPVSHALWRVRRTRPQAGLSASERRRNVRGAFRLSPLVSRRVRRALIEDRVIVLVDDVMTTGATLQACAEVLREAGAREVRMLTLARAPLHGGRSPVSSLRSSV